MEKKEIIEWLKKYYKKNKVEAPNFEDWTDEQIGKEMLDKFLKPYGAIIQVCPLCNKVDVHKDDGHLCNREWREHREDQLYGTN